MLSKLRQKPRCIKQTNMVDLGKDCKSEAQVLPRALGAEPGSADEWAQSLLRLPRSGPHWAGDLACGLETSLPPAKGAGGPEV